MNRKAFRALKWLEDPDPAPYLGPEHINFEPTTKEELDESVLHVKDRSIKEKTWVMALAPSFSVLPAFVSAPTSSLRKKLHGWSDFLRSFEYNHIGKDFFVVNKSMPFCKTMDVAKSILRECLPIKCLEAVACGVYLTRDCQDIVRFPLRFCTSVGNHVFWHIVLAVYGCGKFGALGISRRPTLDFRDLVYDSLSDLTLSYIVEYSKLGHTVNKITIGLPFGTKEFSAETIFWHFLLVCICRKTSWRKAAAVINAYFAAMPKLSEEMKRSGTISNQMHRLFRPIPVEVNTLPLKSPEHHCFRYSAKRSKRYTETKRLAKAADGESATLRRRPRPPSSRTRSKQQDDQQRRLLGV